MSKCVFVHHATKEGEGQAYCQTHHWYVGPDGCPFGEIETRLEILEKRVPLTTRDIDWLKA
jgi:hypothetical protein